MTELREALTRPLSELERYAGWLGKDHVSVAVRADVHALGAAMDVGNETSLLLLTLDKDIGRLPSGDLYGPPITICGPTGCTTTPAGPRPEPRQNP